MTRTHLTLALATLAALGLAAATAQAARAQVYDAATQFSIASNPNGVWSYGYETTLGGTFNIYTLTQDYGNVNIQGWYANLHGDGVPAVFHNQTLTPQTDGSVALAPDQLAFHPGQAGEFSIVRFTAPAAGLYSLAAAFTAADFSAPGVPDTTTDVHILDDNTPIFGGEVTGAVGAADATALTLAAGDTVDFVLGDGTDGTYNSDSTGISATLTAAPEPSQSAALGLGLLGLAGLGWKARKRDAA